MGNQKLLIIDDSPDIHELVRIWLADEPLEFFSSYSGEEGLGTCAQVRPDLILLDVDLPGLDGFQVCRRFKATPPLSDIPVVFLTGASSTEEKLLGLELGACDYVTKPFDPPELRARVRAALNTKRLMDLLAQEALTLQESEERFRVLAENSSDVISRHNPEGVYLYVSPAASTVLGYSPESLIGRKLTEFVHPEDVASVSAWYSPTRSASGTVTFRFRRNDQAYIWLESASRTLIDPQSGTIKEIHASARDISSRKEMEYREQVRAEALEMIAEGRPLSDILRRLITAVEQQDLRALAAGMMLNAGRLHHYAPNLPAGIAASIERQLYALVCRFSDLAERSSDRIFVCDLQTDPAWEEMRPAIREHGLRSCWAIMIRARHREASGIFILYRRDDDRPHGPATEMLKLASELTGVAVEHHRLTDQLTFQAQHDAMTQLPNRVLFADRLQQALATSARSGRPTAVLLLDVDRFKSINDTYGHQAGDELLCQVARRLGARLRTCDALARMGGDEFAAILGDLSNLDDAHRVALSLIEEFKKSIDIQGRKHFITVSIGSAVFPRDAKDASTLLRNADLALYRAKDDGRNGACAFTPDMGEGTAERLELEGALRQSVTNGELRLHYQPKMNPAGQIVGLEALIRWQHPTLGLVPPIKFISLAEDTGVIVPIGTWVLAEAARQSRAWLNAGLPLVPISVNVSTLQFAQADFIRTVSNTLSKSGLPERWLEIELTESLLMRNIHDAADKLAQLREMNIAVAIDDFGTGYSSLAYLQRLSIDALKIDHSFVSTIEGGREGRAGGVRSCENGRTIIRAIVALAKSLGLQVVAEGVETAAQREFLLQIKCDLLQGYLFSPPRPAEQIEEMLRQQMNAPALVLAKSA